ncbi:hypothetical protein C1H46_021048 [Malus baccata]|uniref:Uncharacterized protein n=1 Tax=Malus baccata TaxID=106549 RepID=A0A540M4C5_MALBA|nr:hypothetical protein C1H46_021048 [Malus baccata]
MWIAPVCTLPHQILALVPPHHQPHLILLRRQRRPWSPPHHLHHHSFESIYTQQPTKARKENLRKATLNLNKKNSLGAVWFLGK